MRLTTTLLVFSALAACFLPFAAAVQHTHNTRFASRSPKRTTHKSANAQVIAQRQHHVHRDLVDLCLNLEAAAIAPILHILDPLAANIRLCLCINDLNIFLDSDVGILLGSILGGKDSLLAKIKLLINTSPQSVSCTFPTHSHKLCVSGQPCAFECDPPYVQVGKECACPPPKIECNGVCGDFPHGCSSAVPQKPRRELGPITSYAAAKAVCTPGQIVCGIPGHEGTKDFECVDTSRSLDSCGGCIEQHGFSDGPSSPNGIDCGHLPGVVASYCSESRCVITQCRSGWHLDAKRGECVKISAGIAGRSAGSRMNKATKRSDFEVETAIDSELAADLDAYVLLVLNLCNTSQALSAAPTSPHAPDISTPNINHLYYTNSVLVAAIEVLNSPTVVTFVANLNTVVNVNALAVNAFDQCACTGSLGSLHDDLIIVLNASLALQDWCGTHRVVKPSDSTDSSSIPNTSSVPIRIGLDHALRALGVASRNSHIDVYGLGSLTPPTNNLLNSVGLGPANVRPRFQEQTPAKLDPELFGKTKILVDTVVALKTCDPNLPPAHPSDPPVGQLPPANDNLINAILEAVDNLLNSHTVSSYIGNIDTVISVNQLVESVLESCDCVGDLGIAGLIEYLVAVTEAALDIQHWCSQNPVVVPGPYTSTISRPHPTGTPTPSSTGVTPSSSPIPPSPTNSQDPTTIVIDIDLNALLSNLGLDPITGGGLLGLGGLLDGLLAPINTTVNSSTTTSPDLQVDSGLLVQIQGLGALALTIQSGSAALPTAPANSTPIVGGTLPSGSVPIDSNLVTSILQATLDLCTSGTAGDLLLNLQLLADINTLVHSSLTGCNCVGLLGLGGLVTDVENLLAAVLNVQTYCSSHPVVVPTDPHTSALPSPTRVSGNMPTQTPSTGADLLDTVINLDLGDLVSALTLGLTTSTNVNITADLGDLLSGLVGIIVQIQDHSTTVPPTPTITSAVPTTSAPTTSPPTLSQGLINELVQAVADLLNLTLGSTTMADILASVNGLLDLGSLLGESVDHCECVSSLGLEALEHDIDVLLNALLTLHLWCEHHQASDSTGGQPDTIKIDTHDLLAALGLDNALQVKGDIPELGLSGVVDPLLNGLGLGGVRRWLLN
ncbi:hypothetical protein H0H87_010848 [Tephrocybe sp. NHM501043]|nr:hypothetical protein H0H87_010848 [Tephrocybe sp. NHM501043]